MTAASPIAAAHIEYRQFPPATLLSNLAQLILARHTGVTDLSHAVVIIPFHAITGLKHALMLAAHNRGMRALIPPHMTTLPDWASHIVINKPVQSALSRELEIYQALKRQHWFDGMDLLGISSELLALCNELSAKRVSLPERLDDYAQQLAQHYQAARSIHRIDNNNLNFEARLTHEIWHTLATPDDGEVDQQTRYTLQLVQLAKRSGPLYLLGTHALTLAERQFLIDYQGPVILIDDTLPGDDAVTAVDQTPLHAQRMALLGHAWHQAPGGNVDAMAPSTVERDLVLYTAHDIEDEATSAAVQIKQWLRAGYRDIAIVALDRLAARRLRALLERDDILVRDEMGWPYSTTSCATVVMRWLEALQDGFYYTTLLDLIKSPFIFTDHVAVPHRARIKAAILHIERTLRRHSISGGLVSLHEALTPSIQSAEVHHEAIQDALQLVQTLMRAEQAMPRRRLSLSDWLTAFDGTLAMLGILPGLARDAAGQILLTQLKQWQLELQHNTIKLGWSEWCQWLRARLETLRFRDHTISSPIVFTSLEAARYRHFDAALLLGATHKNMTSTQHAGIFFNQSVRAALGLTTLRDAAVTTTRDLFGLLNRAAKVWVSWQDQDSNGPQLPSPWISSVEQTHLSLFCLSLKIKWPQDQQCQKSRLDYLDPLANGTPRPAPIAEFEALPQTLSVSACQSLIDCPYQFFARYRLKLREQDDIQEEMQKRDYGDYIHQILHRFHQAFPLITDQDRTILTERLHTLSDEIFHAALRNSYLAHAWYLQWCAIIPAYLTWQQERELAGWRWHQGELDVTLALPLATSSNSPAATQLTLTIRGRIDRVDRRTVAQNQEEYALIDYKTQAVDPLKKRLQAVGEDVQLPSYVAMLDAQSHPSSANNITEAAYVSLHGEAVKTIALAEPAMDGAAAVHRFTAIFNALHTDPTSTLPAQGIAEVCNYCEMRGLCRRDYWHDPCMPPENRPNTS